MSKKVTLETLSQLLGLSKNTISKALNGDPSVKAETRQKVFQIARELNYKSFRYNQDEEQNSHQIIVVLTTNSLHDSSWVKVLYGIESTIRKKDGILQLKMLSSNDIITGFIPNEIDPGVVNGVVLIGIYNEDYVKKIIEKEVPIISIDTYAPRSGNKFSCDVVMPENFHPTYTITQDLISKGYRKLGFIGDIDKQASIRERWNGFCTAMSDNGIQLDEEFLITKTKYAATESCASFVKPWSSLWFETLLPSLSKYPEAYISSNDNIALNLNIALQELGSIVPKDIKVTGFDSSNEYSRLISEFSTVFIDKEELGRRAIETLFWRIDHPDRPYCTTYIPSKVQLFVDAKNN